jgi:bifunctional UDP-N-acetylglucosamine pyrophosphorylase/glucosamine-1-phosphate N-acetyltransferase
MTDSLSHTAAIVLAAGRGTRMKAKHKNKVAFLLHGRPMIARTVAHLREAGVGQIIAVVGFQAESVKAVLGQSVDYAMQKEALGTGDALKSALPSLAEGVTTILSVYGDDSAFYPVSLYQEMIHKLATTRADLLFLTIHKDDPTGLGRIVRDQAGRVAKIVEEKNASPAEKQIQEINTGFYCFSRTFLESSIDQIQKNPLTGEYYATDLVEIALRAGRRVEAHYVADDSIWHGVNNRSDFAKAQQKIHD